MTAIAHGNIQARLRMIYLYHLASTKRGLVMDTDNLTENNLGYFTIHGDVGDFNPIGGLWKTEVFELAKYLIEYYDLLSHGVEIGDKDSIKNRELIEYTYKRNAIKASLGLKPTAGLGITNTDLEELGAESYEQVDTILQEILTWEDHAEDSINLKNFMEYQQIPNISNKIIESVAKRHFASEFKRNKLPIKVKL